MKKYRVKPFDDCKHSREYMIGRHADFILAIPKELWPEGRIVFEKDIIGRSVLGCLVWVRDDDGMCKWQVPVDCLEFIKTTKRDIIDDMDNDALARFLALDGCVKELDDTRNCDNHSCKDCWLDWLNSEM